MFYKMNFFSKNIMPNMLCVIKQSKNKQLHKINDFILQDAIINAK